MPKSRALSDNQFETVSGGAIGALYDSEEGKGKKEASAVGVYSDGGQNLQFVFTDPGSQKKYQSKVLGALGTNKSKFDIPTVGKPKDEKTEQFQI